MKLLAIARNTVKETIRKRSLHITLALSFLLLLGQGIVARRTMQAAGAVADGQTFMLVHLNVAVVAISLLGVVITVLIAMSAIPHEVERRTTYTVFSRPVRRYVFVLGKFLGIVFVVALNLLVMATVAFIALSGKSQDLIHVARALAVLGCSLTCLAALVTFFSTFMGAVPSAILGFCAYELGKQPGWIQKLSDDKGINILLRLIAKGIYHITPRVDSLDYVYPAVGSFQHQQIVGFSQVGIYIVILLLLASWIFGRKEL